MLGRWQPFHDGHYTLFKEIIKNTGQVCIQIRDVQGVDDNPFALSNGASSFGRVVFPQPGKPIIKIIFIFIISYLLPIYEIDELVDP